MPRIDSLLVLVEGPVPAEPNWNEMIALDRHPAKKGEKDGRIKLAIGIIRESDTWDAFRRESRAWPKGVRCSVGLLNGGREPLHGRTEEFQNLLGYEFEEAHQRLEVEFATREAKTG